MPDRFLKAALRAAERAGALLLRHHGLALKVRHKGSRQNLVTDLDTESETIVVRTLRRTFPDHDVVGEEKKRALTGSPYRWYIDPLDGTVNYVHALPVFSVSIGLALEGRPLCGVVLAPAMRELFTAERGRGAFRNGRRIRVSRRRSLRDSFLVTGFPYQSAGRRRQMRYFDRFTMRTQALRRLGCASMDFCYTACGVFDGFWEMGLEPWDMAAGALIVEEAGGRVTNFRGMPFDLGRGEVVASNGRIHAAMVKVIDD
jgi:myo-inositol-1(or 4)-monophosphatase